MRIISVALILSGFSHFWGAFLFGQSQAGVFAVGLTPKNAATDYEFHAKAEKIALGASYMGRSFAAPDHGGVNRSSGSAGRTRLLNAGKFLVIETAVFALPGFDGEIRAEHFSFRLNGAKFPLPVVSSGFVAYHLQHPEDDQPRRFQFGGGMGGANIGLGGPPAQQERFPGDPRPGQQRLPGAKEEQGEVYPDWDAAVESYLPEGPLHSARAGNLFFEYKGKMTKVKQMELLYDGPGGKAAIKLR